MIELAQLPHTPIQVRGYIELGSAPPDLPISIRIREYGRLADPEVMGDRCGLAGEEYNPLKEFDQWHRPNPFQDPARGRISDFLVGDSDADQTGIQRALDDEQYVLQNLEGKNGIIGRSLSLILPGFNEDGSDRELNTCCVIGREAAPVIETPAAPAPTSHAHPQQYQQYHPQQYHPQQYQQYPQSYPQQQQWTPAYNG